MKTETNIVFTFNELEMKEAITKHFIDRVGTAHKISNSNIEFHAELDSQDQPFCFTTTISIRKEA